MTRKKKETDSSSWYEMMEKLGTGDGFSPPEDLRDELMLGEELSKLEIEVEDRDVSHTKHDLTGNAETDYEIARRNLIRLADVSVAGVAALQQKIAVLYTPEMAELFVKGVQVAADVNVKLMNLSERKKKIEEKTPTRKDLVSGDDQSLVVKSDKTLIITTEELIRMSREKVVSTQSRLDNAASKDS